MEWLNFHHLLLFTTLVREGSLVAAGRALRLSHSTLSAQIRAFEQNLGAKLVQRQGRRLVPTETGRVVVRYGEEIFGLGKELLDTVHGRADPTPRLRVGITTPVPKHIVRRLLAPLVTGAPPIHLVCSHDVQPRAALARLGLHEIDVVLADAPAPPGSTVRAYNHLLGSCEASFFGAARFAHLRRSFPSSLAVAPMLLPLEGSPMRRAIELWFSANGLRPRVAAELEDSALLKLLGQDGLGVFVAPSAVEREIEKQYGVTALGRAPQIREQLYAITLERRIKDPAIQRIFAAAQADLFVPSRRRRGAS